MPENINNEITYYDGSPFVSESDGKYLAHNATWATPSGGGGTVGSLNTNNSTAQTVSSSESFSGNISLHKVSKTGKLSDLQDTQLENIIDGQTIAYNSATNCWINTDFPTELPSVTGNANKMLVVNNGATGVEWRNIPTELPSISGNANKILAVNSNATGVVWITNSGGGSIGTLNTSNSTAQTVSSSESFSNNINLHKVSKTGNYNDLLNKPTIPVDTNDNVFIINSIDNLEVERESQDTFYYLLDWAQEGITQYVFDVKDPRILEITDPDSGRPCHPSLNLFEFFRNNLEKKLTIFIKNFDYTYLGNNDYNPLLWVYGENETRIGEFYIELYISKYPIENVSYIGQTFMITDSTDMRLRLQQISDRDLTNLKVEIYKTTASSNRDYYYYDANGNPLYVINIF